MTGFQHISIARTKDDIVWLTIDSQESNENALTISLLKEMREILDNLQDKSFKGLIISSAKSNSFIAGTKLDTLLKLTTQKKAEIYTSLGNQLCRRISRLDFPTIALINGNCSNSGLEIALCCDYRIATDNAKSLFCYSDIKQGHYAGFGSLTRLIKIKGLVSSLAILEGNIYSAKEALSIGLIDYVVPAHKTHQAAHYLIAQNNNKTDQKPSRFNFKSLPKVLPSKLQARLLNNQYNSSAISSIIKTWDIFNTSADASHNEAIEAAKLIISEATKNQLKLQKQYQKLDQDITAISPQSQRIHIIGCGVMGRYIARLCAENGFYISIYDTRSTALEKLLPELYQDCNHTNHAKLRHTLIDRIVIDVDNSGLAQADIIIEAIPENKHAKASLLHDIEKQAKQSTAILSTTACLPLEEIAKGMKTPQRLAAFNPYHPFFASKVAEISTHKDNPQLSEHIKAFSKALQLKPIHVKSNSGYLGTRLLMTYLIESMLIHQSGISTQAIDKLTANIGMRHAPFDVIDSIGISECLKVNEALADRLNYDVPNILMKKSEKGLKGKNSGAGFYRYKKGKKQHPLFDKTLNSPSWKHKSKEIEKRLIEKIINEARSCQQQNIVADQEIIDLVATIITGFSAEKGGPLAYLQQLQSRQAITTENE